MSQEPSDPRLVDRGTLAGDPILAPAPLENTEQASRSAGGVVRQERVVTDGAGLAHSERTVNDVAGAQRLGFARASQFIWLCIGIVEILIGLRVVLKLIGANPSNAFATFIYGAAGIFVTPFSSLIGSPATGRMVLEIPSLIAMLIYALLGWVIVEIARVLWQVFSRSSTSSTSTYDRYRD